jgi:spermidine synthase
VGVIGLGTGTVAAYGEVGDVIRFYEINPVVERLARHWFTFLPESRAHVDVVTGDARISLASQPGQNFNVIVVDAFTGDAIPVHLLTREALNVYRRNLRPDGIVAFHVSNQYVNLEPVVAALAGSAGLVAVSVHTHANERDGFYATDWILVTGNQAFLRQPEIIKKASRITEGAGNRLWTDDYSSVFPLLKWQNH